jgi:hypothetical protein
MVALRNPEEERMNPPDIPSSEHTRPDASTYLAPRFAERWEILAICDKAAGDPKHRSRNDVEGVEPAGPDSVRIKGPRGESMVALRNPEEERMNPPDIPQSRRRSQASIP